MPTPFLGAQISSTIQSHHTVLVHYWFIWVITVLVYDFLDKSGGTKKNMHVSGTQGMSQ